ncbi:MAG: energy transducer TonB [Methylococcaceae bacterium]|nr:energy transducer TonB [Methylococcaceae bacterium]
MNFPRAENAQSLARWKTYGLAIAVSLLLHALSWQIWQKLHLEPPLKETPAKVLEVSLVTLPPKVLSEPPAQAPSPPPPPKPEPPKPKKPVEKPRILPKPAPKPKPRPEPKKVETKPEPESAPAPEPVREETPPPAVEKPAPPKPTPPAFETAKYNSPSLHNPRTSYPRRAQEQGWEGTVILRVQVLPSGEAGEISVARSSEHDILDEAAVDQVKEWRFEPARKGDTAVASTINIPITFKLKH